MKSFVINFLSLLLLTSTGLLAEESYSYRWCREVGNTLQIVIQNSTLAKTYEEEKQMIIQGINISLEKTPTKDNQYFTTTLNEIFVGLKNYTDTKEQVLYLRQQVRFALSDLKFLDQAWECPTCAGNNAAYVIETLTRGLEEGMATKTDAQENFALNHAISSSMRLLNESSYSRYYSCSKRALEDAFVINDLEIKKDLMRSAINYLNSSQYCRQW